MIDRSELYQVFLGKKEWRVEGIAPVTEATAAESLRQAFDGPFGVIVLAGGRGTRLGMQGPKGCLQVGGKSLFEHLLSKAVSERIWVAIMTSPDNHEETKKFLEENDYFGIRRDHVDLFVQPVAPTLSREGEWLEKETPSGNGAMFRAFCDAGLLGKWKRLGIGAVNVVMIDNLRADPSDLVEMGTELVVKTVRRRDVHEQVGMLGTKGGRLFVQEYFELSEEEREKGQFCNTGLFSCSLSFLEKAAQVKLPWHLVQKESHFQFETFIFDAFPMAESFAVVEYPREQIFAAIKSIKCAILEGIQLEGT